MQQPALAWENGGIALVLVHAGDSVGEQKAVKKAIIQLVYYATYI
jgi:hypothetical protein